MLKNKFNSFQEVYAQTWVTSDGTNVRLGELPYEHLSNIYWLYRAKLFFNHRANRASAHEDLAFANALGDYIRKTYGGIGQYSPVTPDEVEVLRAGGMLRDNGSIYIGGDHVGHTNIKLPPLPLHTEPDPQSSRVYNNFTFHPNNRPIDRRHVEKLKKAIVKDNFLHENPIVIDTNNRILDGQHRFQAARELSLPIYYVLEEETAPKVRQTPASVVPDNGGNPAINNFLRKAGVTPPVQPRPAVYSAGPVLQSIGEMATPTPIPEPKTQIQGVEPSDRLQDRAILTWAIIRQDLNIGNNTALNEKAVAHLVSALNYAYEQGLGL